MPRATLGDHEKLIEACKGYIFLHYRLITEVLFKEGLRYIDMIRLSVDDFYTDAEKIIVCTWKNEKYREVPIVPSVKEVYLKYLPF
ncbi:tyrosine-type recombinase/integrase [Thermoplasma volcanium]|uniref:tyrosine-type recombinase/integrase n=1 Tax=Thermoplasma volcanium TaxID=50339 RepID=UPI00064F6D51|nr:tyrosine-type recombinase/integrase [Thermoplasma volcanium]